VIPRPRYEAPAYRAAGKLKGKVALVTGGDSGIGRAVAVLFAKEGADVAIVYLASEQTDAEETRRAVKSAGTRCLLIPGDLTNARFCREVVEKAMEEFGRLDVLVNNAAFQESAETLEDISDEQFDQNSVRSSRCSARGSPRRSRQRTCSSPRRRIRATSPARC
jgi:NADP-dependent 3-hydroxy acid dehydrogenase YdfG